MSVSKSSTCIKCDIGIILRQYLQPLLQLLQKDPELKDFNLSDATKCLNTSVLLMVFMAGKKKGIDIVNQCDTVAVTARHKLGRDNNTAIMQMYSRRILTTNFSQRHLYYILLTDGWFKKKDGGDPVYFPGHVFILEKIRDHESKQPVYFLYQSYINQYDLNGYFLRMNGSNKISREGVSQLLKRLSYIISNKVWDQTCFEHWKGFTNVETHEFLDTITDNEVFVCIRSIPLTTCMKNIEAYIKDRVDAYPDLRKILVNVRRREYK